MRIYHAMKQEDAYLAITRDRILLLGRNVTTKSIKYVHISLNPFTQGSWALDVIGADTNEAWIIECEIADDTPLISDPADDAGEDYNGGWMVCESEIPILKVHSITYIDNVQEWESGDRTRARMILKRGDDEVAVA